MKTHIQNLFLALALFASVTCLHASAVFTTLAAFTYTNAPNYGWNFETYNGRTCALVQGDDGNFYGTTSSGGHIDRNGGTVFKMTPNGAFTSLYLFGSLGSGNYFADGGLPSGNLIKGADGSLYGTTKDGGNTPGIANGTVFRITTNGTLATLYSFGPGNWDTNLNLSVNYDGRTPAVGLVLGSDGNFYGTTTSMGAYGWGTVFRLTTGGILTTLHSFDRPNGYNQNSDGWNPESELVEGNDGNFYGTMSEGGAYAKGTVFKITPTGTFTTLISLNTTNGYMPFGGLVLGNDGNFYGTTVNNGTIFRITTNGIYTVLHHFTGLTDGSEPDGSLIQGTDGNFYGTASAGGNGGVGNPYGSGTVFQITPSGTFTTLYAFSGNGSDGHQPQGALVQGKDGSFYGTTSYGGPQWVAGIKLGYGTIFRITLPPVFQSITPTNGAVTLAWSVMTGQTYQLQSTTDLSSTNWINLGSAVTATNATASATDDVTNTQCFYRLQLLP